MSNVNNDYHEHIGQCVHEFKFAHEKVWIDGIERLKNQCSNPDCDKIGWYYEGQDKTQEFPAYDTDKSLAWDLVVKLNKAGYHITWDNILQQHLIIETYGKGSLGMYDCDPNPIAAVLKATMKLEGDKE